RHLLLGAVENAAKFVCEPKIDSCAMDLRAALEFRTQTITQLVRVDSDLLKQRPCYSVCLIEQRREKMLIRNFLVIGLRSYILRCLKCLLHLLRELIDPHASPSAIASLASNAVLANICAANMHR